MSRPRKSEDALPWERQTGEGDKAFAAFCVYRDMGSERSIVKAARAHGKSVPLLTDWSRTHGWVDRVRAYDDHQDRLKRETRNKEIEKMRDRQANLGQALQMKAARALARMRDEEVRPGDVVRMAEIGAKLEKLARGEPDTITENRTSEQGGPEHGSLGELAIDIDLIGAIQAAFPTKQGQDPRNGSS